jgi:hypothetical protein
MLLEPLVGKRQIEIADQGCRESMSDLLSQLEEVFCSHIVANSAFAVSGLWRKDEYALESFMGFPQFGDFHRFINQSYQKHF